MSNSLDSPAHKFVLGGARSGKTRHAMTIAEAQPLRIYIATAQAFDAEMSERIAHHKAERGDGWQTIEAPLDLASALHDANQTALAAATGPAVVVDCLTLWLTNLVLAEHDLECETHSLLTALSLVKVPVILVSNELGLGIVPDNSLARKFRDAQGRLNQAVAAAVPSVIFVAAGLPLKLKDDRPH